MNETSKCSMNNDKMGWINKPPFIIEIEFHALQQIYQISRSLTQSKYNCEDTHSATTDNHKVVMNEKNMNWSINNDSNVLKTATVNEHNVLIFWFFLSKLSVKIYFIN